MEGKKIKMAILDKGMTLSEIAKNLGMSQQTLSAALQGGDVKTGLMEKISAILGEDPSFFYTGESSGTAVVNGTVSGSTVIGKQEGQHLADQLAIKDQQIDRLLGIIEHMQGRK